MSYAVVPVLAGEAAKTEWKFDFGSGPTAAGYVQVVPTNVYTAEAGYGFEGDTVVVCPDSSGKDPLTGDYCTADKPFLFSVAVPEGNYRVTVTLGAEDTATDTTIKAESRRLMVEQTQSKPGESIRRTFTVNIRNSQIAGGEQVRINDRERGAFHWDDRLTLEFNGKRPCVCAIEMKKVDDVITVFLAGDSTVTDQTKEPWASWGQMLPRFFKPEVATTKSSASFKKATTCSSSLHTMT
jgi:hypothetical protein